MMTYKGYLANVAFDDEADIFHGEVISIRDVITFQGRSVQELHEAFKDSIEDYLTFCEERGESPDKAFSGNFPLRATPEDHRIFFIAANKERKSLNSWAVESLRKAACH